jgi:hypothetical protein
LGWAEDCSALQARLGASGSFGGSPGVSFALKAFEARAIPAVEKMLQEIAHAVRTRSKEWYRLHEHAEELIDLFFGTLGDSAEAQMFRGSGVSGIGNRHAPVILGKLKGLITLHGAGWSAPEPEPWAQRHPIVYAMLLLIAGVVAGAVVNPIGEHWVQDQLK